MQCKGHPPGNQPRSLFVHFLLVQGTHSGPIVIMEAQVIFLAFECLDECVAFFAIVILRRLVPLCPLITCLLLLFLRFLGLCFLVDLSFSRGCLLFCSLGSSGIAPRLLEGIDLRRHCHNRFMIFCGLTPCVFFVK